MQDTMVQELALANKQLLMVSSSGLKFHPLLHYSFSHWDSQAPGLCHYTRAATLTLKPKLLFTNSLYPAAESQSGRPYSSHLVKLHLVLVPSICLWEPLSLESPVAVMSPSLYPRCLEMFVVFGVFSEKMWVCTPTEEKMGWLPLQSLVFMLLLNFKP